MSGPTPAARTWPYPARTVAETDEARHCERRAADEKFLNRCFGKG